VKLGARVVFGISLAANAAALYLLGVPAPSPAGPPAVRAAAPTARRAVAAQGADLHAYLAALLARGLTLEETKPLVLARLMREAAPAAPSREAEEYWRSGYAAAALGRLRDRLSAADRVRSVLATLYGPQVESDAAFRQVFQPLDDRYAFLGSEQQLALQKYLLERRLVDTARPSTPRAVGEPAPAAAGAAGSAELEKDLRARLGPEAAQQYLYRFSPLAEQLRAAKVDLSEAEFRTAFEALAQLEAAPGDAASFGRIRASLRSLLGEQRFTRLWAARDPLFGVLASAGRGQSLSEATMLSVYALFNDMQDRLASVAERDATIDPPRAAAQMRDIQSDVERRLADLVGDDSARALVRATKDFSVAMRRQATTNLRE
jgi:hypothetical protein